ncbi:MAG: hypothetical protein WCI71_02240 [Bacteroidota bacterium]
MEKEFHTDGRFICECRTEESMKALAKDPEDRRKLGEALAKQRRQIKNVYTAVLSLTDGLHVLSPMEQLIAPPDVKIISANERKSVKGASHKFVEYAIAGQESRDAEFAKMLGTEIAVEVEEPRPAIEFREDKKSAETLDFQRKLDATLLRREGGDDKAQIDDFKLEDTGKVEDTNKKEEMSDDYELDKDFR